SAQQLVERRNSESSKVAARPSLVVYPWWSPFEKTYAPDELHLGLCLAQKPLRNPVSETIRELVVFAGAGVSKGPPSNYPDFNQLANRVAQQAGGVLKRDRNEPIDHFLGKLKKQGPDVHTIVRQILSNPESRPTELHYDLLSLFRNPEDIRIVTTNFDCRSGSGAERSKTVTQLARVSASGRGSQKTRCRAIARHKIGLSTCRCR
ncbi:hypothetical protein HKBW3S42_01487, partial [Candidatus Hakubella thermalkaliphila]